MASFFFPFIILVKNLSGDMYTVWTYRQLQLWLRPGSTIRKSDVLHKVYQVGMQLPSGPLVKTVMATLNLGFML